VKLITIYVLTGNYYYETCLVIVVVRGAVITWSRWIHSLLRSSLRSQTRCPLLFHLPLTYLTSVLTAWPAKI